MNVFLHNDHVKIIYEHSIQVFLWKNYGTIVRYTYVHKNDGTD